MSEAIVCPNCRGGGVLWDDIDCRNETCYLCDGTGRVDSETFDSVTSVTREDLARVRALFLQKLAEKYPDHPWTK